MFIFFTFTSLRQTNTPPYHSMRNCFPKGAYSHTDWILSLHIYKWTFLLQIHPISSSWAIFLLPPQLITLIKKCTFLDVENHRASTKCDTVIPFPVYGSTMLCLTLFNSGSHCWAHSEHSTSVTEQIELRSRNILEISYTESKWRAETLGLMLLRWWVKSAKIKSLDS